MATCHLDKMMCVKTYGYLSFGQKMGVKTYGYLSFGQKMV